MLAVKLTVCLAEENYQANLSEGKSIAIGLDFYGTQPNHFEVPKATSKALVAGRFCGDTRKGGTCNVETITLTPHCNGTHTETVGHIVNQKPPAFGSISDFFFPCNLISVSASPAGRCEETYIPELEAGDEIITRKTLEAVLQGKPSVPGLIIRTLPNYKTKRVRKYDESNQPPFFSCQAIHYLVELGIRHLLVDLPSLDRLYDDGMMSNHRLYWSIEAGSKDLSSQTDIGRTVTEMIFVEDELKDGLYAVNLQIPPMLSDAVPSNPVLFPLTKDAS